MKTYVQIITSCSNDYESLVDKINKYSETYNEEILSLSVISPNLAIVVFREKEGAE